jgi:hypothetical protein
MADDMMKLRALAEKTPAEQLMEMEVGAPTMPPGLDRNWIGLSPKCRIFRAGRAACAGPRLAGSRAELIQMPWIRDIDLLHNRDRFCPL